MNAYVLTLLGVLVAGMIGIAVVLFRVLRDLGHLTRLDSGPSLVLLQNQIDSLREQVRSSLEGGRQRIGSLRDVLSDPDRSQIFLVTIPEAMSVFETQRTLEMLASASMPVASVIVNQLQPDSGDCLHCKRRRNILEARDTREPEGV